MQYNEKYATLTNDTMELKLIHFDPGNDVEIPYYWYEIIPKALNKSVGKVSIRLGDNYHSYYNGHIGYEVDEDNIASYKTMEKLGAELGELVVPPKDYFGWYEGIPLQRIYKLELQ